MTPAQMAGRRRDPPGCSGCSESVLFHGEPRQQRRRYMDGSWRSKISAIHYPRQGKLSKETVRSDTSLLRKKASSGYDNVFSFFSGDTCSFSAMLLT